jgi:ankyrin repeat protein
MISKSSLAVFLVLGLSQVFPLPAQETNAQESIILDVGVLYEPRAGEYGVTELMIAAMHGDSGKVRELLEAGAKVDEVNDIGATAFMGAAYGGDLAVVEVLLEWNADVNHRDNKGDTVLGSVIWGRDARMARVLLAHGANPNVTAYASETSILQHAAVTGQADIVDLLIEYDVDLAAYGEPSLTVAAWQGKTDIVRALLNAGVDANAGGGYGGQTAVHMAAQNDHVGTVKLLIEHGADVNRLSSDGVTPLRAAIYKGSLQSTKVLLTGGAMVSREDLLLAVQKRNASVIDEVLKRFNIAALTTEEADELLIAAESAQQPPVISEILRVHSQALSNAPARLLYAKQDTNECAIALWNPVDGNTQNLVGFESSCPEHVFVAKGHNAIFVIADEALQLISFESNMQSRSIDLPNEQIDTRLIKLQKRLGAQMLDPYGQPSSMQGMTAKPTAAGILGGGGIGLVISSSGPADGTYAYLYALRGNDSWSLVEERVCHRFEWPCEFEQLNGRKVEYWPDFRKIWHPRTRTNEYFAGKTLQDQYLEWDYVRPDVVHFDVDSRHPLLAYSTSPESHGDYLATSMVKYATDDTAPLTSLCQSCETSLASRYMLVGGAFAKPSELFDLGTGDSVFGALAFATWVE